MKGRRGGLKIFQDTTVLQFGRKNTEMSENRHTAIAFLQQAAWPALKLLKLMPNQRETDFESHL
jgi:hypothetical protein